MIRRSFNPRFREPIREEIKTSDTVNALADHLERIDADWRKASGYTGRAVYRRAYWRNMAARLLADSVKALAGKPQRSKRNETPTEVL